MCAAFYSWSRGPSTATVLPAKKEVKGSSIDVSTKTATYDQLTVQIPSRFLARQKTPGQGQPIIMQELFTVPVKSTQSIFSDKLAVTIGSLAKTSLIDVSDVQLRVRDSTYILIEQTPSLLIFEKTAGYYEIGAFISNKGLHASFVMTGLPEDSAALRTELRAIVSSVVWL